MYAKTCFWFVGCSIALSALAGCTLDKKDDADEFREAVPEARTIALSGPDSNGTRVTAAASPGRGTLASAPAQSYAKWYGFTRQTREGANAVSNTQATVIRP